MKNAIRGKKRRFRTDRLAVFSPPHSSDRKLFLPKGGLIRVYDYTCLAICRMLSPISEEHLCTYKITQGSVTGPFFPTGLLILQLQLDAPFVPNLNKIMTFEFLIKDSSGALLLARIHLLFKEIIVLLPKLYLMRLL